MGNTWLSVRSVGPKRTRWLSSASASNKMYYRYKTVSGQRTGWALEAEIL